MLKKICCGKEYGLEQVFCGVCGRKIEVRVFCDKCNEEIIGGGKFCSNCGETVKDDLPPQAAIPVIKPYAGAAASSHKNKTIGMAACGILAVVLFLAIILPKINRPIVGVWNAELIDNTYTSAAYVEFKGNGTFNISTLGFVEKGKYKIVKNGKHGTIRMMPEDLKDSSYETSYVIEGDILVMNGQKYKKR